MLYSRIDHQIRLYGQRNFGQVPMFDMGTTSKSLKIRTQGVPSFSFIYLFILFIFNIKLNIFLNFFFFIWVWSSHCCNTVVTCRYVPHILTSGQSLTIDLVLSITIE